MAKVMFNTAKVMVSLNIDSNVDDLTRPGLRPGEFYGRKVPNTK